MERFFWKGNATGERHLAISQVEEAIRQYGYLTDFKMYSDVAISMVIEMEDCHLEAMYHALAEVLDMDDSDLSCPAQRSGCWVYLQIFFPHGTGDLQIEVPAIPG